MNEMINRGTGLLLIDVTNSNPNGDPDRDSDPRIRQDKRGEISPVSFKRKLRDLVDDKESWLWKDHKFHSLLQHWYLNSLIPDYCNSS
jgi:CRISPR-associated protein Csd2